MVRPNRNHDLIHPIAHEHAPDLLFRNDRYEESIPEGSCGCVPILLRYRAAVRYPGQNPRRATVVGAGSFGTAVAVLLTRAGVRTTLLCRTEEQAQELEGARMNERYLDEVDLPRELKVRTFGSRPDQFARPDLIFLAVPSKGLGEALEELRGLGVAEHAGVVSLAKGCLLYTSPSPRDRS